MVMNLKEWSLRLGLISPEEDKRGDWSLREIGQPKQLVKFNAEEAWKLIRAKGAGPFKTSESKGEDIADPVLRMAHFFLANNLLGHINTTIRTIELYFMWCMVKEVKVHLGYWLAHSCHKIAHHPVRHLYACHLLGAYLIRNIMPRMMIPRASIIMCEEPEWFDTNYFISLGIIKRKGGAIVFCEAEQSDDECEEKASEEGDESEEDAEVKTLSESPSPTITRPENPEAQPRSTERRPMSTGEMPTEVEREWRKMVENKLLRIEEAAEEKREMLELQTDRMTKALSILEKTISLAEKNNQLAQQFLSSASVTKGSQPKETTPITTPTRLIRKRKDATTTSYQPTAEELENPSPLVLKRVKLERAKQRTKHSGSPGGQRKN